jgi:hypothetical protein
VVSRWGRRKLQSLGFLRQVRVKGDLSASADSAAAAPKGCNAEMPWQQQGCCTTRMGHRDLRQQHTQARACQRTTCGMPPRWAVSSSTPARTPRHIAEPLPVLPVRRYVEGEKTNGRWAMAAVAGILFTDLLGKGNWFDAGAQVRCAASLQQAAMGSSDPPVAGASPAGWDWRGDESGGRAPFNIGGRGPAASAARRDRARPAACDHGRAPPHPCQRSRRQPLSGILSHPEHPCAMRCTPRKTSQMLSVVPPVQEYWLPNNALLAIEFLVLGFLELKRYQGWAETGQVGIAGRRRKRRRLNIWGNEGLEEGVGVGSGAGAKGKGGWGPEGWRQAGARRATEKRQGGLGRLPYAASLAAMAATDVWPRVPAAPAVRRAA